MIVSFAVLLLAAAIGCACVWSYSGISGLRPRWAAATLAAGAGIALGFGATSILWFLAGLFVPEWRAPLVLLVEAAGLAAAAAPILRRRTAPAVKSSTPRWDWTWMAACAVLIALAVSTATMTSAWEKNPQGNWDAWAIWNLRAKYLASEPGAAARAWSPLLADTHPEYPLLLSGAVARAWAFGGNRAAEAPIAIGYFFFLSLAAAATGGIALARGSSSGLMAGLILLCTPGLVALAPTQYSDVPLAAYFVCAAVFALLDRPLWAGLFAGMAAWTKDEGLLFCAVLLVALAAFRRAGLPRLAIGLAPGLLVAAGFKLMLAPHVSAVAGAGALARIFEFQRYPVVISSLATYFLGLGAGWYHPVLPLAAFGLGTGLRRDARREAWLWTAVAAAVLAGYTAVLLATANDLKWQIGTALDRLLAQWWPLAVVAAMTWLRPAEEAAPTADTPPKKPEKRKRR